MKYMLLMQFNSDAGFSSIATWSPGDVKAHIGFMKSLNEEFSG